MLSRTKRFERIETNLVHGGDTPDRTGGAVVPPVFQSANYLMAEETAYDAVRYIRLNNSPNHQLLSRRLAIIESAQDALPAASGMAAITATLFAFLRSGDDALCHRTLYGGTQSFLDENAAALGITYSPIDMAEPAGWERALKPQTRLIFVEGISNPLMEVGDLRAVVEFARQNGLVSVIDNTFCTPINFRPIEIGFDVVVHSATKYLNGHNDIVAGVVASSAPNIERIRHVLNHLGGSLDPHACFLLHRGLKTLALRVERHNTNALALARWLVGHPAVSKVNYPGLPQSRGHEFARTLFAGYGGMMSFDFHRPEQVQGFLSRLCIPLHAASLGGAETLVVLPARSSHLGQSQQDRERIGITDSMIRVSTGIESIDELIADFGRALED